jgi:hypothetical protein
MHYRECTYRRELGMKIGSPSARLSNRPIGKRLLCHAGVAPGPVIVEMPNIRWRTSRP